MGDMRKITIEAPDSLLASAQAATGTNMAETVRTALRELVHRDACQRLLALQGKVDLELDLEELRKDKDEE